MRKIRFQPDLRSIGFTEFGSELDEMGWGFWFRPDVWIRVVFSGFGPRFRTGGGGKVGAVGISGTRWQWLEISGFDRNQQVWWLYTPKANKRRSSEETATAAAADLKFSRGVYVSQIKGTRFCFRFRPTGTCRSYEYTF
ncbi:hypothetical protein OROMI_013445 [Orobanche minor]